MSYRAVSWLAWSVCAVTLLVLALSMLLIALGWSTPLPGEWTPWRDQTVSLLGIIGAPILGGLIASRRPRNAYGWLWLGFGLGLALQSLAMSYEAYTLVVEPGSLAAPRSISHVLELGGQVALTLAPLLMLLFPTGRLPSRRWRPLAWISTTAGAVLLSLVLFFDNPEQVGGAISITAFAVVSVIFTAILLSALSIVVRYRWASGAERQQLKWFALAAVLIGVVAVGHLLFLDLLLPEAFLNLLDAATITGLYVAVGIAILRYRLYDIDRIINRTLVYGSLTVSLALVYFGGVASLQGLLRALTGQGSQLAIVASTLAIAALFNPLRRRIQSFIDRRFYRRKYDAAKTLEGFSARLRDETDLDELSSDLERVVREAMQPEHVSLWLRKSEEAG
ncbi:MAG: hypothetical protein M3Q62_03390 [Actinomycetota bacterium]|nr:hypothetical protein [Rubrobacteraceae bacterium]MBA3636400.1 hypothetical protein [Rubrobacteraceae bacterium]MDQ3182585.1 hypothetical protein [Actinomycetota bacterium]MDQ3496459.1 hypothetical protein [Actinomycetota bacterium]